MMRWYRCEEVMPGEKYDVQLFPDCNEFFLVCCKRKKNASLFVSQAILVDGKFITKGQIDLMDNFEVTHWMLIELP